MLTIFFGFACLVTLIAVWQALRAGAEMSAMAWFLIASVSFVNIGFFVHFVERGSLSFGPAAEGLLVTSSGLLCFAVATIVGASVAKPRRGGGREILLDTETPILVALAVLMLGPAWLYFGIQGTVPLFEGLSAIARQGTGGLGALNGARLGVDSYVSGAAYVPGQGIFAVFRNFGSPVVFTLALLQIKAGKSKRIRVVVMVLAVVTVLAGGQRWPLMYLLLAAVIASQATASVFRWRPLVGFASVGALMGVIISTMQMRTLDRKDSVAEALAFGLGDLADRIFVSQVAVPIASYHSEDPELKGLWGSSYLDSVLAYLPGPGASYPVEFFARVNGDWSGYTAPPDFYTEAYINFGYWGVLIASLMWALILAAVGRAVRPSPSALSVALRSTFAAVAAFTVFSGVTFLLGFLLVALVGIVAKRLVEVAVPGEGTAVSVDIGDKRVPRVAPLSPTLTSRKSVGDGRSRVGIDSV